MDATASAAVAATARISKSNRLQFRNLASRDGYPPDEDGRLAGGLLSGSGAAGAPAPSTRESFAAADEDEEGTGHLAAALIELGYSVEYAPHDDTKLAAVLTNRPNVVLCVCSTARMSDLGLLERFS